MFLEAHHTTMVVLLLSVCQAAALQSLVLRHHMSPARPRLLSPRAQQGPLEDGFKGLMPLNEEAEGNVEPSKSSDAPCRPFSCSANIPGMI